MKYGAYPFLFCLLSGAYAASPVEIHRAPISLGTINGSVSHNVLKIEEMLSDPILFTVTQQELVNPLKHIVIRGATLATLRQNEALVAIETPVEGGGSLATQLTLDLWLDGKKVPLSGHGSSEGVVIAVPKAFETLVLRSAKPVTFLLPKSYKGRFELHLDIEGRE